MSIPLLIFLVILSLSYFSVLYPPLLSIIAVFLDTCLEICCIENKINEKYFYDSFMIIVSVFSHIDQLRNSYLVGNDHSLRVIYANGMDTHYQTEPHILAGTKF